jgi:Rrf2 family transcriptional regulator, iron-sulfur cluster assembly transcription factor
MQVVLGRKGDYSVRAMLHLARHGGAGRQKARVVADAMEIPHRYATQILADLVAEGLLVATAGPDGGYELARPSDQISLLDVVEAAEGPIRLQRCVLRGGSCDWSDVCPVHEAWSRAQEGMIRELARTSFGDLERIDAAIAAGTYRSPTDTPLHEEPTPREGKGDSIADSE